MGQILDRYPMAQDQVRRLLAEGDNPGRPMLGVLINGHQYLPQRGPVGTAAAGRLLWLKKYFLRHDARQVDLEPRLPIPDIGGMEQGRSRPKALAIPAFGLDQIDLPDPHT